MPKRAPVLTQHGALRRNLLPIYCEMPILSGSSEFTISVER